MNCLKNKSKESGASKSGSENFIPTPIPSGNVDAPYAEESFEESERCERQLMVPNLIENRKPWKSREVVV